MERAPRPAGQNSGSRDESRDSSGTTGGDDLGRAVVGGGGADRTAEPAARNGPTRVRDLVISGALMSWEQDATVLELVSLPRDQVGPFLLLGLDKDATAEQVEAHWAQRVLWARKGRIRIPLEDINWAREALKDADQRAVYEVACLNVVLS